MRDLPTRKQVSEWLYEFCDSGEEPIGLVVLRQRLVALYADGVPIDGQAIADAWDAAFDLPKQTAIREIYPELADLLDALTEEIDDTYG